MFLSYSHEDHAITRAFAEALEAEGLDVWWDITLRSGEAYDERIETALREAKAVVVLWSKRSVQSRWVRAEATLADRNRTLVPVMVEACERPIMFELTQTTDLANWDGDTSDKAWKTFLKDLRQFTGGDGPGPVQQTRSAAPAPSKRGGRPSLAILPFTNRSGEKADDIFSLGMVEDVIAALSISRGVQVIAQSATAVYRKNVSDLRSIGRELGARYILEGNLRRVGEHLRVTVQLVEAENGAILWTEKFDRPLAELAYLQEDLVIELANQLGVQVQHIEMERALKKPGDLTAWEAVMRAWAAYARFGLESLPVAVAEARKAIAIDPDYAIAHGTLAMGLGLTYSFTGSSDKAVARDARVHIDRALALDPGNATVLFQVANACCGLGLWDEALAYAERSVDINPNIPSGRQALAFVYCRFGRPDEAIAQLDAEAVIAPRGFTTYISMTHRTVALMMIPGRTDEALKVVEQALALAPNYTITRSQRAALLAKLGRRSEAETAYRRWRAIEPAMTRDLLKARCDIAPFPQAFRDEYLAIHLDLWDATTDAPADT